MTHTAERPSGHTFLDFNAPLSDWRAAALIASLQPLKGKQVVDLGCGWAELLLRIAATEPTAHGLGIDSDADAILRGRHNAQARGLADSVQLDVSDATNWHGKADVVLSIGASHAWGGSRQALEAAQARLAPGGLLLFGDGIWERPPTTEALTALDATADEFESIGGLVDLAIECGFRPLSVSVANTDEWDSFESRFCAGRERWLLEHPDAPNAAEVRAAVDDHRNGWLHGYRGVLGFAYLTLARPDNQRRGLRP
jgi:SAM-dependent methyltransferase